MGLLDRWLRRKRPPEPPPAPPEHAVLVSFAYGSTDPTQLFELEDRLVDAVAGAGVGEFDGNEMAADGSEGVLYLYGPDADALWVAVRPVVEAADFMRGARVTLRYGPPQDGVREDVVTLGGA